MPDPRTAWPSRAQQIVIAAALVLGVALRLRVYLANRSLWLDEAYLALNLIERDLAGLLRPLAYNQAAPLGFLVVERLLMAVFGAGEYALRAFPLVAGIVALLVFSRLASALLQPVGATMGVTLFAISGVLIYYAAEVKQYGTDAAVTVLLWTAFVALEPGLRKDRVGAWAAAAGIGALAIWFSHPAVFVLGGIALRWVWLTLRAFEPRSLAVRAPAGLVWVGSFGLSYAVALRQVRTGTALYEMWERSAAPVVPLDADRIQWYVEWLWTLSTLALGQAVSERLLAVLIAVGLGVLWYRRRDQFWWTVGAMVLAWLASALGHYPLSIRLWVFAAPIMILLVSAAADEAWRRTGGRWPALVPALALVLLALPMVSAARVGVRPPGKEEIRPLLEHVREHRRDGDRLYLFHGAGAQARYYAARGLGFPGDVVVGSRGRGVRAVYERDVERLRGTGRVWVLFSHVRRHRGVSEETLVLEVLDAVGRRLEERRETGAAVYLYDL